MSTGVLVIKLQLYSILERSCRAGREMQSLILAVLQRRHQPAVGSGWFRLIVPRGLVILPVNSQKTHGFYWFYWTPKSEVKDLHVLYHRFGLLAAIFPIYTTYVNVCHLEIVHIHSWHEIWLDNIYLTATVIIYFSDWNCTLFHEINTLL